MSSRVLLGVAATAICGLLVGLWMMIRPAAGDSVEKPPRTVATRETKTETSEPQATAPAAARKVTPPTVAVPVRRPTPSSDPWAPSPSAAPAETPADPAEVKRVQTRGWLKTQVIATEAQMIECMEKAGKDVTKLDGAVAFPLVVSRKNGKIVTEAGPSDYATVGNQDVVNCMAGVMKTMSYDELPEGATSVTSYRKITVKDGVVVEDWLGPHEIDAKPSPK